MSRPLQGRRALITGASRGLGLAIARAYVRSGAELMLCARTASDLAQALEQLRQVALPGQRLAAMRADVSDPGDVQALVEASRRELGGVDILVSNAGVAGPLGGIETVDFEAWRQALAINLFAPVLLCKALLPDWRRAGRGKIVQVSGGGATSPLPRLSAYAASKAAVVRLVETLARELEPGIEVNALAPGPLDTRMLDEFIAAGPQTVGADFHARSVQAKTAGGDTLRQAAELAVFLGSAASDGISGRLISARWDPWRSLAEHIEELRATDVYTLRRIVPKDRGLDWGEPE